MLEVTLNNVNNHHAAAALLVAMDTRGMTRHRDGYTSSTHGMTAATSADPLLNCKGSCQWHEQYASEHSVRAKDMLQ